MPILGYKKQLKNIPSLKDSNFTINFKLQYKNDGSLALDDNKYFDSGDFHLLIDKAFDNFTIDTFNKYDNGIMILSICKYLIDTIPNIYSIVYEDKLTIDTYYKEEIINAYNNIKGE